MNPSRRGLQERRVDAGCTAHRRPAFSAGLKEERTMGPAIRASDFLRQMHSCKPAVLSVGLAWALEACGGVTPPPRFSAVSPADTSAPEATVPSPAPLLSA